MTKIEICSKALQILKTSHNDGNRLAENLFSGIRDSILKELKPRCAIKTIIISKGNYPVDLLEIISEELKDDQEASLTYLFQNTDISTYDDITIKAIILKMVSRMAYSVTGNIRDTEKHKENFDNFMHSLSAIQNFK